MISTATTSFPELQAIESAGGVFFEYQEELEWLANLLTGDKQIAEACVIDAWALAQADGAALQEWPVNWARMTTIRSAVEVQQTRFAQLSPAYAQRPCIHGGHCALAQESIEFLIAESGSLIATLDVLCRFALVLCGLEKSSTREAALLLGVEQASVEGAYCAALRYLKLIGCEQFRQQNFAAMLN